MLTGAGALLVAGGICLSRAIPINYRLWTPSFFMAAGGIACLSFTIVDLLLGSAKIRSGANFLRVLGMNPIIIWILAVALKSVLGAKGFFNAAGKWRSVWLISYEKIAIESVAPEINALLYAMIFVLILYGMAQFLHSRRIFIRI